MKKAIITLIIIAFLPITLNAYTAENTAKSIIKSLKTEPENWRHDQYKLYYFKNPEMFELTKQSRWQNKADCVVWIANGDYGVEIQAPKRVKLPRKVQKFIWDTYQLWANEYFAKVFEDVKEIEAVKKPEPVKSAELEFTSLLSESKVEREPDDFFSQMPNWTKGVTIAFFIILTLWILLGISRILKRKKD